MQLPAWLNGTLDIEASARVELHLEACSVCQHDLESTLLAIQVFEAHIPSEDLADYALGLEVGLPSALIDGHLEQCPSCRQDLALLVQRDSMASPESESILEPESDADLYKAPVAARVGANPPAIGANWLRIAAAAIVVFATGTVMWTNDWLSQSKPIQVTATEIVARTQPVPEPDPADGEQLITGQSFGASAGLISQNQFEDGSLGGWTAFSGATDSTPVDFPPTESL